MSPTPEQLEGMRGAYAKEIAQKEAIQKRLSELNETIESVSQKCCEIVGGGGHKDDCSLSGYLLDTREEEVSLHPIIIKVLAPGGAVTDYFYLMAGGSFSEPFEISQLTYTNGDVYISDHRGWLENYPVSTHFFYDYHNQRLGLAKNDSSYFPKGIVANNSILKDNIGVDEVIRIKEAMVEALANAAGIKAEDEVSEGFPLLLDQLKRIKAGKTLSER